VISLLARRGGVFHRAEAPTPGIFRKCAEGIEKKGDRGEFFASDFGKCAQATENTGVNRDYAKRTRAAGTEKRTTKKPRTKGPYRVFYDKSAEAFGKKGVVRLRMTYV
jgi:hypothetical protein